MVPIKHARKRTSLPLKSKIAKMNKRMYKRSKRNMPIMAAICLAVFFMISLQLFLQEFLRSYKSKSENL